MYASFLGISDALYLVIFHQPPKEAFLRQAHGHKQDDLLPEYEPVKRG